MAELAIGLALIFRPSARWAALAAFVLLAAFIAGIGQALAYGEQPDCHCFRPDPSAPAGRTTLARNALLAVGATAVVAYGCRHVGERAQRVEAGSDRHVISAVAALACGGLVE